MNGDKGVFGNICSILSVYILIVSYYTAKATNEAGCSFTAESMDALCAIANCSAPNAQQLCPKKSDPNCYDDFGFVVDVSGSVESHWQRERTFVKRLAQPIWISPEGGHASVELFSRTAGLMIPFDKFANFSGFERALDDLTQWHGTTRIDLGLEVAMDEMFQLSNGMRPGNSHTLVLITDGHQTGTYKIDYEEFRKKLNDRKIRVLVILVGNSNKDKIRHLVNKKSDMYEAKNFDDLIRDEFISKINLCDDYSAYVECRDKSAYCKRYKRYARRFCKQKWFTSGSYSCKELCGLC